MWFIVVTFLAFDPAGNQALFVFTDPSFETAEQCSAEVLDSNQAPKYVQRMLWEYGGTLPGRIQKVSCAPQKTIDFLKKVDRQKGIAL